MAETVLQRAIGPTSVTLSHESPGTGCGHGLRRGLSLVSQHPFATIRRERCRFSYGLYPPVSTLRPSSWGDERDRGHPSLDPPAASIPSAVLTRVNCPRRASTVSQRLIWQSPAATCQQPSFLALPSSLGTPWARRAGGSRSLMTRTDPSAHTPVIVFTTAFALLRRSQGGFDTQIPMGKVPWGRHSVGFGGGFDRLQSGLSRADYAVHIRRAWRAGVCREGAFNAPF